MLLSTAYQDLADSLASLQTQAFIFHINMIKQLFSSLSTEIRYIIYKHKFKLFYHSSFIIFISVISASNDSLVQAG